uniref:Protein kinase domain-containing protein n=1 Tax=Acrobeloides nanus TaxID=290746 RepID=A0A914EJS6_9BILA
MDYLKTKNIVHGDLATRNVLISIVSEPNNECLEAPKYSYQVQVADFGLAKIVNDVVSEEAFSPVIPIKWAAIELVEWELNETFKKLGSIRSPDEKLEAHVSPSINEKTDVWSFGVTIWEIFNYGKNPYCELFARLENEAYKKLMHENSRTKMKSMINSPLFHHNQSLKESIEEENKEEKIWLKKKYYVIKGFFEHLDGGGSLKIPKIANGELVTIMTCWMKTPSDRPNFGQLKKSFEIAMNEPGKFINILSDGDHQETKVVGKDLLESVPNETDTLLDTSNFVSMALYNCFAYLLSYVLPDALLDTMPC